MTYKIRLKDGTVIENIPNDTTFNDAQARIKKGFPNLNDDDLPKNYFIDLPNGKSIEFESSVSIPEAHVILSKSYPSFSVYDERGSKEKAIDNLVVVSASFAICFFISVLFIKKYKRINNENSHMKSIWWSGWLSIFILLISLVGTFNSPQKIIYYPKFWDLSIASQALLSPILVLLVSYFIFRILFKFKRKNSVTEEFYALAAKEIDSGTLDEGLWARLYSEKNGDTLKTKAAYIKERADRLQNSIV